MGTLSHSIIYYKQTLELKDNITTYDIVLRDYSKEREILINQCGPAVVRAVTYDQPKIQSGKVREPDGWMLLRIGILTGKIKAIEEILKLKRESLEALKESGKEILNDENYSNIQREVFIKAWIEGKTNKEIAMETNYEYVTIKNIKTELNNLLKI